MNKKKKTSFMRRWLSDFLLRPIDKLNTPLSSFDTLIQEIRPGDVILIAGRNRCSRLIRRVTQSPWTHAALYIGKLYDIDSKSTRQQVSKQAEIDPSSALIIESILGQGTIISKLCTYKAEHLRICRPRGITHSDAQALIDSAVQHVGKSYNIRHFFDLGRFLLASKLLPPRLGSSLFKSTNATSEEICSTMIAEAFATIKFPILPRLSKEKTATKKLVRRNPKLFTPSDFDFSPYFDIIKYPMLPSDSSRPFFKKIDWADEAAKDDN